MRAHDVPIVHPPQPGVPLPVEPTVHTQPDVASPAEPEPNGATDSGLSRRGFLRVAGAVGLTGVAASVAACTTTAAPAWSFGAPATPGAATAAPSSAPASEAPASGAPASAAPSASASPDANIPSGWTVHDIAARDKVRRYVGNLAPALKDIYPEPVFLKLAAILGVEDDYPELQMKPAFAQVPNLVITDAVSPLKPTMDGDVKVFDLTIDEMEWNIDELLPSVAALGYNAQWPGPTIRATEGDKLRVKFKNNLPETTKVMVLDYPH